MNHPLYPSPPARPNLAPAPWQIPGAAPPLGQPVRPATNYSPVNPVGMAFLYLFIFLLVSRFCDIYLSGLRIPLLSSVGALLFALTTGNIRFALSSRASIAMLGLTLWMVIGTPFSLWRGGSIEVLSDWLKSFISFIVILAMLDTVNKTIRMLQTLAAAVLCAGLLTIVAGDTMAGRLILHTGRYSGPNELATACVMGLICWWFVVGSNNIKLPVRLLLMPIGFFVASLVPKTGSRGALITISVTLIFFLARLTMLTRIVAVLGVATAGSLMLMMLPPEIRLRYTSLFTNTEVTTRAEWEQMQYAQGSQEERWRLFVDSLLVTARYPIFGTGAGNFGVARHGTMVEAGQRGSYQGTHNTYTQISSELGLPAFAFFIWSLISCWKDIRRVIRAYKPLCHYPRGRMVYHTAHTLWLMLVAYLSVFVFEYLAYSPLYLVICATITAFSAAAMRELQAEWTGKAQAAFAPLAAMPRPGALASPHGSWGMQRP